MFKIIITFKSHNPYSDDTSTKTCISRLLDNNHHQHENNDYAQNCMNIIVI